MAIYIYIDMHIYIYTYIYIYICGWVYRRPPPRGQNWKNFLKEVCKKCKKTCFSKNIKQNTRTVQSKKHRNCCVAPSLGALSKIADKGPDFEPISKRIFEKCIFQKTRSKSIGLANEKMLVFAFSKIP